MCSRHALGVRGINRGFPSFLGIQNGSTTSVFITKKSSGTIFGHNSVLSVALGDHELCVLQCVAVCCSALQCVAVRCSCCGVFYCVAGRCRVLLVWRCVVRGGAGRCSVV